MGGKMQNPFQYGKVVSDPFFTDRDEELARLLEDAKNRHNVVLHSPRRYGKTSLLMKLSRHLIAEGYKVIYLDFYRVSSREDFIELYSREIMAQYSPRWKSTLKKISALLKGIRPGFSFDPLGNTSISITYEAGANIHESLESVINLPEKLDEKAKWLIIFDEFQEISKLNGDRFDDVLRSEIQHHKRCSYIFSGSRYHLLLDLFNKPGKAFYRFGKVMQLPKIPARYMHQFLLERFSSTGIKLDDELANMIIEKVENIPNYVQYLAGEIWNLSYLSNEEPSMATLDRALNNIIDGLNDYFLKLWEELSPSQKKVLLGLLVHDPNPYSQEFQSSNKLGAISTTQRALEKLIKTELICKEGSKFLFTDPLFKLFLSLRISA